MNLIWCESYPGVYVVPSAFPSESLNPVSANLPMTPRCRPAMDHQADVHMGTLLLAMARDARQEGDVVTAELLFAEAMRCFDEGDRFVKRWRNFEGTP